MKPERIQNPFEAFPAWTYRQTDELRRQFALDSYKAALNLLVALIELAEDYGQQPDFHLRDDQITVCLKVPESGLSEQIEAFVEGLEELWQTAGAG